MTKSTITREESIQAVFDLKVGYTLGLADIEILKRVARMALVAMDSEAVAIIDQANLDYLRSGADADVWPPEREEMGDVLLYRHAQPAPVAQKEPISFDEWSRKCALQITLCYPDFREKAQYIWDSARETQQPAPVVPEDVLDALQKVARIRLDLNGFDGDRRGIADCLCDAEEALIEVVNRRAAMLQELKKSAGTEAICRSDENVQVLHTKSPAQSDCCPAQNQGWIPVSERMPEDRISVILWDAEIGEVTSGHYSHKTQTFYHCGDAIENEITHWMPPPCAPQEMKGE